MGQLLAAPWVLPAIIGATSVAGTTANLVSSHQQAAATKAQTEGAKQTAIRQQQVENEKAPELAHDAGLMAAAVKKKKPSFGMEESVISQNIQDNLIGNKTVWG